MEFPTFNACKGCGNQSKYKYSNQQWQCTNCSRYMCDECLDTTTQQRKVLCPSCGVESISYRKLIGHIKQNDYWRKKFENDPNIGGGGSY